MVVHKKSNFAPFLTVQGPFNQKKKVNEQNLTYLKVQGPPEILTLKKKNDQEKTGPNFFIAFHRDLEQLKL